MGNLLLDASSPAIAYQAPGSATVTTASFTPPANSLLVVMATLNTDSGETVATPTAAGGGLAYTLRELSARPDIPDADGQVVIFTAPVPVSASMTVTVTNNSVSGGQAVKVMVFTDDSGSTPGVGANGRNSTNTSLSTWVGTYTASAAGSRGVMAFLDWNAATPVPTAGTNTTLTGGGAQNQGVIMTYAYCLRSTADGSPGVSTSLTLNGTSANDAQWAWLEVTPADIGPGYAPPAFWPGDGPNFTQRLVQDPRSVGPSPLRVTEWGTTAYVTSNATTVVTPTFTPSDSSLLVALVGAGNGTGGAVSLGVVSDSLGGTWTRLGSEVVSGSGAAEIWARDITTGAPMTVTFDPGGAVASGLDIICKWYGGAAPRTSQPGATATNGGTTSYQTSITTTTAGSMVVGSYGRASDAQTVAANANTTLYGQVNGASGDTAATFGAMYATTVPGTIELGFANPAAGINRVTLVEILPAVAPAAGTAEIGVAALGLTASGTAVHVGLSSGPATFGIATRGTAVRVASTAGSAAVAVAATGAARKVTAQAGSCAVGLGTRGTAVRRQAQTGTAAFGVTSTGLDRKVAPQGGPAPLGVTGTGWAVKVAVGRGPAALAIVTVGGSAKRAAAAGAAPLGVAASHSSAVVARPQTGACALGIAGYATARKVAPAAGRAAAAITTTGAAAKRSPTAGAAVVGAATRTAAATGHGTAGRACLGLVGRATARKTATGTGSSPLGLASTGWAVKRATPAGVAPLSLTGSSGAVTKRVASGGRVLVGLTGSYNAAVQARQVAGRLLVALTTWHKDRRTLRPNTGTTPRPVTTTILRPSGGATPRPAGTTTPRPYTSTTPRP